MLYPCAKLLEILQNQYKHCCLCKYFPYSHSFHWFPLDIIQVNQQLQSNMMTSLLKCKLCEVRDWVFPFTERDGFIDSFTDSIRRYTLLEHSLSGKKSETSALSTTTHNTVTDSDSSWISNYFKGVRNHESRIVTPLLFWIQKNQETGSFLRKETQTVVQRDKQMEIMKTRLRYVKAKWRMPTDIQQDFQKEVIERRGQRKPFKI